MKYYAVRKGRKPGIYNSWPEAQAQISGFSSPEFIRVDSEKEANDYINNSDSIQSSSEAPKLKDTEVIAYVDGSFNPKTNAVGSSVIFRSGIKTTKPENIQYTTTNDAVDGMRNVGGEIIASTNAIHHAIQLGFKSITIFYDYIGIEYWATGSWNAKKTHTIKYRQNINAFRDLIDINFVKVAAHTGIELNELADITAKKAVGID